MSVLPTSVILLKFLGFRPSDYSYATAHGDGHPVELAPLDAAVNQKWLCKPVEGKKDVYHIIDEASGLGWSCNELNADEPVVLSASPSEWHFNSLKDPDNQEGFEIRIHQEISAVIWFADVRRGENTVVVDSIPVIRGSIGRALWEVIPSN